MERIVEYNKLPLKLEFETARKAGKELFVEITKGTPISNKDFEVDWPLTFSLSSQEDKVSGFS